MTVGGTGDVLAGLVAALYSRMNSPFDASALAVYFNGVAATIAVRTDWISYGSHGFDRKSTKSNEAI